MGFVERKRWLLLGLPWTFTKYTIEEDVLTINQGFFNIKENDCYMYKITDVELLASLFERVCGLGTIKCITGDKTHPVLYIEHVKNAKAIKNFILEESEKARIKRRTVNMQDIGGVDLTDMADIDDMD